jgi:hypothetical protein
LLPNSIDFHKFYQKKTTYSLLKRSGTDGVTESFSSGKMLVYPQAEDTRISEEEQSAAPVVMEERIAAAGARLADVLNRVFADGRR